MLTEAVGPLAPALVQVQQHARLVGVRVMVRVKRTLAWRGRLKGSRTVGRQADRCGCLGGGSVAWWEGGVGVLSSEARAAARLKVGGGRVHECDSRRTARPRAAAHSTLAARSVLLWRRPSCSGGVGGPGAARTQAAPRSSRSLRLRSLRTSPECTPSDDHFLRKSRIALGGTWGGECSSVSNALRSRMLSGESSLLSAGGAEPCGPVAASRVG